MSPFSCQAKRDIKYFRSRARDGTGAESRECSRGAIRRKERERVRKRGKGRVGGRVGEKDKEAWRTVPLARTENRKTIAGQRPTLRRRLGFPTTPSRLFFLPLSFIFYPSLFSVSTPPPPLCAARGGSVSVVELYHASLYSGADLPFPPRSSVVRLKSAFEILKPRRLRGGAGHANCKHASG